MKSLWPQNRRFSAQWYGETPAIRTGEMILSLNHFTPIGYLLLEEGVPIWGTRLNTVWASVGNVGDDVEGTLQSPGTFPGGSYFRYWQLSRLPTCELVSSLNQRWRLGVGTEVVESQHISIPLDGSGSACGGRDVLGLRRHSMSTETMRWLMLSKGVNGKGWSLSCMYYIWTLIFCI